MPTVFSLRLPRDGLYIFASYWLVLLAVFKSSIRIIEPTDNSQIENIIAIVLVRVLIFFGFCENGKIEIAPNFIVDVYFGGGVGTIGLIVEYLGPMGIVHLCRIGLPIIVPNCKLFAVVLNLTSFLSEFQFEMKFASFKVFLIILPFKDFEIKNFFAFPRLKIHGSTNFLNSNIFFMP